MTSTKPMTKTKTLSPARRRRSADDAGGTGVATHAVIQRMLAAGVRQPTAAERMEWVGQHIAAAYAAQPHRLGARQRLLAPLAVYFQRFVPPQPWQLEGSEVTVGRSRLDLLWTDGRELFADELKTGTSAIQLASDQVDAQAARQTAAGARRFGECFLGVRVLLLAAPGRSFWVRPDGSHNSLPSGGIR